MGANVVKIIRNDEDGTKIEIHKHADNAYYYKYYEYFSACGWRFVSQSGGGPEGWYYDKDAIEWQFDVKVA